MRGNKSQQQQSNQIVHEYHSVIVQLGRDLADARSQRGKHQSGSYNVHCAGDNTVVCKIWRVHGGKPQIVTIAWIQNPSFKVMVGRNLVTN
jgi:hypothetical protein